MTKLMIFCDGTWNSKALIYSNVCRLYKLVKNMLGVNAVYYNGVGTGSGWFIGNIVDGAYAGSLESHIKSAYNFIVKNYREGDEILLFGLSRGAYTVRCVAGMLYNSGLVPNTEWTNEAYRRYRSRDPNDSPNSAQSLKFKQKLGCKNVEIKFLGLWDTVGAAGIPIDVQEGLEYMGFYDKVVSKIVRHVSHALAIHERISVLEPCHVLQNATNSTDIKEVWFPGEHLDVGGARVLAIYDISTMTFKWMINQINQHTDFNIDLDIENDRGGIINRVIDWMHPTFDYALEWVSPKAPVVRDRRITTYKANALYNDGHWDGFTLDILNAHFTSQTYNEFRRYMMEIEGVELPI